jgi:hypothetical protein
MGGEPRLGGLPRLEGRLSGHEILESQYSGRDGGKVLDSGGGGGDNGGLLEGLGMSERWRVERGR